MEPIDRNSMQRMPVALSDDNIEDVTVYTVFPSSESHFFTYLFDSFIARVLGLLSMIILVYALFFVKTSELPSDGDLVLNYSQDQYPEKLHMLLHHAAASARREGALSSITITPPAYVVDGGIEFLVFATMPADVSYKKAVGTNSSSPNRSINETTNGAPNIDPLDVRYIDERLHVAYIPPKYSLLLNKYNTLDEHALLVTQKFHPQSSPLSDIDLEAWIWCLEQTSSVGFYNSDLLAGASQKHKHMQLVPLQSIAKLRHPSALYALPIDDIIMPLIRNAKWKPYIPRVNIWSGHNSSLYSVHQFTFLHGVAVLLDPIHWAEMNRIAAPFEKLPSYSIYLKYTYRDLIASLGLKQAPHCSGAKGIVGSGASRVLRSGDDDRIESRSEQRYELPYCEAYNLILTSMWMMAVPRSAQKADGLIAVNGLGFVGLLLARGDEALGTIKQAGPLRVLHSVTFGS